MDLRPQYSKQARKHGPKVAASQQGWKGQQALRTSVRKPGPKATAAKGVNQSRLQERRLENLDLEQSRLQSRQPAVKGGSQSRLRRLENMDLRQQPAKLP